MALKNRTNMKDRVRGVLFCLLWYFSILFGFFVLICPAFPLVVFNPKLYRKWSDLVFGMWEPFPVVSKLKTFQGKIYNNSGKPKSCLFIGHDGNFVWDSNLYERRPDQSIRGVFSYNESQNKTGLEFFMGWIVSRLPTAFT